MREFVTDVFMYCVYTLQVIGGSPGEYGFGYYLANVLIFVVIHPLITLVFLLLWIKEKKKNRL